MSKVARSVLPWLRPAWPFLRSRKVVSENVDVWADVEKFAAMRPHPVSLQEVLATLEPWRIAKFLQTEVPIRYAERIRLIRDLEGWEDVDELRAVLRTHVRAFGDLRAVDRRPTLDPFSRVVKNAVEAQRDVVARMALGMARWQAARRGSGEELSAHFVDEFLDRFLLNRLGSNVLMTQYLACAGELAQKYPATGIVDPQCNATAICRDVASEVAGVCEAKTKLRPVIRVEAFSAIGSDAGVPRFPYIPSFLRYIIAELLKNSCRATAEVSSCAEEVLERPITIVVCADEHRVAIRVSDRANGIPFDVGANVWSYLYSTVRRNGQEPSSLAGYGVGLPLSRLYARYLGGSLDLVSLPGYGTDAYLMLPRVETEQLEVVPDADSEYRVHSLNDYLI